MAQPPSIDYEREQVWAEALEFCVEGPPAIQRLVRGHHKRQVVGIGRSGRRVIWIEPYWRGPEDAPILTRPYKVDSIDKKKRRSSFG